MKTTPFSKASSLGCIIDASCLSATSLNLAAIAIGRQWGAKLGRLPSKRSDDFDQIVSEMADSAVDHLNCLPDLLPYCSFFFEDNSLFYVPDVESAKEDCGFVTGQRDPSGQYDCDETDRDYPAADFRGDWLHVSDHGNATLYVRESVDPQGFAQLAKMRAQLADIERQLAETADDEGLAQVAADIHETVENVAQWRAKDTQRAADLRATIATAERYTDREIWAIV